MHNSSFDAETKHRDGGEVLVGIAAMVTEGRTPGKLNAKIKGFYDGPHCTLSKQTIEHKCDSNDDLCANFENVKEKVLNFWHKNIPICVEVFLTCACKENSSTIDQDETQEGLLLEQWYITISRRRSTETPIINIFQLINAIRSQLYFSQITAWLTTQDVKTSLKITKDNLKYRLTLPGETVEGSEFTAKAVRHEFPIADIGNGFTVNVSFLSQPRMNVIPDVSCTNCEKSKHSAKPVGGGNSKEGFLSVEKKENLLDDRMYTHCTLKGKHCCEDSEDFDSLGKHRERKEYCYKGPPKSDNYDLCKPSTSACKSRAHRSKTDFYSANPFDYQRQKCFSSGFCTNGTGTEDKQNSPKVNECKAILNSGRCFCCNSVNDKSKPKYLGCHDPDLNKQARDKGQLLLDAIERTARKCTNGHCTNGFSDKSCDDKCVQKLNECESRDCDDASCDKSASDIFNIRNKNKFSRCDDDDYCDNPPILKMSKHKSRDVSHMKNTENFNDTPKRVKSSAVQKLTFDNSEYEASFPENNQETDYFSDPKPIARRKLSKENCIKIDIPTPSEQAKFRKNLDNAASMVFHSQTGLPLTSSPAPVRRGKSCFDFDSSINSVSAIKSALYSTSFSTDEESESESSTVSPCSPDAYVIPKRDLSPVKYRRKGHAANLLGSFEESVLNGRLEPVSTVHGFTAELGASGSFVPKHLVCPVTVFFYTLGDYDKVSSPYLGHINLGKKGYNVPRTGTVQVTLFNPLGTVVKMFVIMYDLSDMPPNSQTFIRQRTLYMPTNCKDEDLEWGPKWLRFLIHLRFMSSKSGKVYLHSDIRMIIFRKSDVDTATAHDIDMSYELRSFTHMPTNPRFSPRK